MIYILLLSYYFHLTVNRLEMSRKRVELEANPSYAIITHAVMSL